MEELHELSRTTVLRRLDPAHSRVLTAEKREIRHVVSSTQVTGNPTYQAQLNHGQHAEIVGLSYSKEVLDISRN